MLAACRWSQPRVLGFELCVSREKSALETLGTRILAPESQKWALQSLSTCHLHFPQASQGLEAQHTLGMPCRASAGRSSPGCKTRVHSRTCLSCAPHASLRRWVPWLIFPFHRWRNRAWRSNVFAQEHTAKMQQYWDRSLLGWNHSFNSGTCSCPLFSFTSSVYPFIFSSISNMSVYIDYM